MRTVKEVLREAKVSHTALAAELGMSVASVSLIVNHGRFPKGRKEKEVRGAVNAILTAKNMDVSGIWNYLDGRDEIGEDEDEQEVNVMLSQMAKRQFRFTRDPFADDVNGAADVYLGDSSRYVAEYMYMTAKVGGMLAVLGESGSGKTTLRRYMGDRIAAESLKVKMIFPRTFDKSRLTASSIADAIIEDCSSERPRRSLEAKARQVERILTDSSRAGWSHVLVIEEAHDLAVQTLKYLKRFWELEDGFKKLLAIILIAQPELKGKLDESRNWEAREIIRRVEVAEIESLSRPGELEAYLALKMKRIGRDVKEVFDAGAYDAIRERLARRTREGTAISLAYPLTVNNLVKRSMNLAAEIGQSRIDEQTVKSA